MIVNPRDGCFMFDDGDQMSADLINLVFGREVVQDGDIIDLVSLFNREVGLKLVSMEKFPTANRINQMLTCKECGKFRTRPHDATECLLFKVHHS